MSVFIDLQGDMFAVYMTDMSELPELFVDDIESVASFLYSEGVDQWQYDTSISAETNQLISDKVQQLLADED